MSDDLCKRWEGYNKQSWQERYAELDDRHTKLIAETIEAGFAQADTIERLRAELDERGALLRECEVKLRDAQGRYCSQQYASNLLFRINTKGGE